MLVKKRGDVDAVRRLSSRREANESRDPSEDKNGEDVPTGVWGGYNKDQDQQISPDKPHLQG